MGFAGVYAQRKQKWKSFLENQQVKVFK